MRTALLVLALCACKADVLFKPLPELEWGCLETRTFVVSWQTGDGEKRERVGSWCVREGWVQKKTRIRNTDITGGQ